MQSLLAGSLGCALAGRGLTGSCMSRQSIAMHSHRWRSLARLCARRWKQYYCVPFSKHLPIVMMQCNITGCIFGSRQQAGEIAIKQDVSQRTIRIRAYGCAGRVCPNKVFSSQGYIGNHISRQNHLAPSAFSILRKRAYIAHHLKWDVVL